ncbi:type IV secretory system conjugative DNA transfer family protein [Nitrosomonas sp. JL21]|uniref:type IV secretory system conjugative DNA transfer family protein n=1 Tax=Nitrosomonas sp. JL21 TaxID=153949 RepID=UPI001369ABF7|nr:type IV secretory system conjugative DNA transfer family protein [Nitrosomonas sp. JL21]MBL8496785.1 type IV secretory system conjugative DNA transfer family protein [Nitrosomonas sp.]MBL8498463.1 type IV secretory system conjugative DNA transfer family protein [Nitrosomonas sp.]MXS78420.1 type IV secretory system conjugative DNA transfer family protein [Nitrosomonas sp. JL21]
MARQFSNQHSTSLLTLFSITAALVLWATNLNPPLLHGRIDWFSTLIYFMAGLACLQTVIRSLQNLAHYIDLFASHEPTGQKGSAAWATVKEFKDGLTKNNSGPFWGRFAGSSSPALFFDFVSNAMTIAPAGSGKGIYTVVTNIMSIRHSKVIPDFKGELLTMLKSALEKRGEIVRVLNPGNLWSEIIGSSSDSYSPLDIISDDLARLGGLRDVMDDLREMAEQLLPEPEGKQTDNSYFREGSRLLISNGIIFEIMIDLYDAKLSSVALLLENRKRLEDMARWIAGVDIEDKPHPDGPFPIEHTEWAKLHDPRDVAEFAALIRARASNILALMSKDGRAFDSFITGAQQALAVFAFGRLAPAMGRSTFNMRDLKEGKKPTTLFIVADSSRMEAFKGYIGLMKWCCTTAMKRHPAKDRPVYFILDEATNYKINGLESLLTWGRSYGIRLHLIFQDFAAFERTYGKTVLDTLLSETEIKQFLPGQRSPKTLEMISKQMLGEQSVMAMGANRSIEHLGLNETISEVGRPLATPDEIRRMKEGILFVRQYRPILFEPVSYAEIEPWRSQVGINPFHGKPFRKKVKLRL